MTRCLLSLALLFFILFGAQPLLIKAHSNTVAVAGSEVTMKCQTGSGNCNGVEWKKKNAQIAFAEMRIFRSNEIYTEFRGRYSVDSSSGCNLLIKNVSLTDAGRFTCEYIKESSTVNERSLLIVLESLPICSAQVNASSDGIAAEGDGIQFICELRLNINATEGASLTWKSLDNVSASLKPDITGRLRLLHSVVAKRHEIPSFECITTFVHPKGITGLASNIPIGPSCTTQPIRPLYPVMTVTMTPSLSVYSRGSTIICSSDGNPPASYRWQILDGRTGTWRDVPGKTGEAFRAADNNDTIGWYRCVSSNTVRGKSYLASSQSFQINDICHCIATTCEGETSMSISAIVFIFIGALSTLLFVCVVLCILKRMQYVQFHSNRPTAQRSGAGEDKVDCVNMGSAITHSSSVEAAASEAKNEGEETAYASLGEERNAQHNYASLAEMRK